MSDPWHDWHTTISPSRIQAKYDHFVACSRPASILSAHRRIRLGNFRNIIGKNVERAPKLLEPKYIGGLVPRG